MYITESDLENFILEDIDSSYSAWINTIIASVEAYIDQYCGTNFAANNNSADRYFDGSGAEDLYIGPVQSISAVKILDSFGNVLSTLNASDYYLYPLQPVNTGEYDRLRLNGAGQYGIFPDGARTVQVTGVWGYSAVPAPVKMAGVQMAAKLINEGLRGGQVSSETLGSYSVAYRQVDEVSESMGIKDILNQYRVMTLE